MTPEQHDKLISEIRIHTAEVVKTTVNGKIDRISQQFADHAITDRAFQEKTEPIIDWINDLIKSGRLFDKIMKYIFWFIITVGTIIFGIKRL